MRGKMLIEMEVALEKSNAAEDKLCQLLMQLEDAKTNLNLRRSDLIMQGKIDGRNEEQREAQLIHHAKEEYIVVRTLEKEIHRSKSDLNMAKRTLETWTSIKNMIYGM